MECREISISLRAFYASVGSPEQCNISFVLFHDSSALLLECAAQAPPWFGVCSGWAAGARILNAILSAASKN